MGGLMNKCVLAMVDFGMEPGNAEAVDKHLNESNDASFPFEKESVKSSAVFSMAKQLCRGIFWVITDSYDLIDWQIIRFGIPCDSFGNIDSPPSLELNSKTGNSYNHKKVWESEVRNNNKYKPLNKKEYDYYPRGRVEISSNKAIIYLNPNINRSDIVNKIELEFGLSSHCITDVKVISDGSSHYQCFLDRYGLR